MKTFVVKKDAIMLDDHEVKEVKAFLLDWLIKFGHAPVKWYDTKEIIAEHKFQHATWSVCKDEKYLTETRKGFRFKLSKKALRFLNGQRS